MGIFEEKRHVWALKSSHSSVPRVSDYAAYLQRQQTTSQAAPTDFVAGLEFPCLTGDRDNLDTPHHTPWLTMQTNAPPASPPSYIVCRPPSDSS
ncbi:hypothetical protein CMUS01_12001 [Colletotrichum musicola]|uniref:Uncharacterized protein n=1 Tax=Colletotrichum musicola TaxID=2175873 RepID=A0A8H6JR94_9PEZI|nr:hypothetical protein CMUS01_12001 [Colletotrichum musicola]